MCLLFGGQTPNKAAPGTLGGALKVSRAAEPSKPGALVVPGAASPAGNFGLRLLAPAVGVNEVKHPLSLLRGK